MAHVMAQAISSAVTPRIESNANAAFNSVNVLRTSEPSLLAQEAFPGELAALRAQVAQKSEHNLAQPSVSTIKNSHSQNSGKAANNYNNLLADQLIDVMPTGFSHA